MLEVLVFAIHYKLCLLLFADYLVLLSEYPETLQTSLNSLSNNYWSLQVNLLEKKYSLLLTEEWGTIIIV